MQTHTAARPVGRGKPWMLCGISSDVNGLVWTVSQYQPPKTRETA